MNKILVSYEILVPEGEYCWKYLNGSGGDDDCICQFFDNEGGHPSCDLGLYGQEKDQQGVLKADRCLNFKVIE